MYPRKQVMKISLLADRFPSSFLLNPSKDLKAMILVSTQNKEHIIVFVSIFKS
ncbi:hypothetical protein NSTC731_03051 [Nostoc sp. DSM 114167]|jgi:hypothetical protein